MLEKDILAYHYAQISGIRTVCKYAPRIIRTADLPLVMFLADKKETVGRSGGSTTKTRLIRAVLFAEQVGYGTETQGYEVADPFFDSIEDYFEPRTTLAKADGTTDLTHEFQDDDGEQSTPYPTGGDALGQFWAITFHHQFTIVKQVIYQSGR